MPETITDGVPVFCPLKEVRPRTVRIRVKKRKHKELTLSSITPQQKLALQNYIELGCNPNLKKEAAEGAGYHPNSAIRAMDSILARQEIKEALKNKNVTTEKIAEVIAGGLDANHPLAKGERPDWIARNKFVQEYNKIHDIYPPKRISSDERKVVLHLTPEDTQAYERYKEITREDEISEDS